MLNTGNGLTPLELSALVVAINPFLEMEWRTDLDLLSELKCVFLVIMT